VIRPTLRWHFRNSNGLDQILRKNWVSEPPDDRPGRRSQSVDNVHTAFLPDSSNLSGCRARLQKRVSAAPRIARSLREHSEYDEEARSKDDREHRPDGHAKMGEDAHQAIGTIRSNIDPVQPSMNK
jgi:hypothetical protein